MFISESIIKAQVVINEIHPSPSQGNDWIELTNIGSQSVDLSGWSVFDNSSQLNVTPELNGQMLGMNQLLVIEVSNRLNNTGDSVIIRNSSSVIVNQFAFINTPSNQSWSRIPDGSGPFELTEPTRQAVNLPISSPSPSTTPSPSNSPLPSPPTVEASPSPSPLPTPFPSAIPSPSPSSSPVEASPSPSTTFPPEVRLSEVQACPETDEDEWLELYNPTQNNYQLTNWKIRDAANNTKSFSINFPASTFTVVTWSGSLLNNDGDTLALERSDGQRLWQIDLPACTKGESWILLNGELERTTTITKGSANLSNGEIISPITTQPILSSVSTATSSTSTVQLNASPTTQPSGTSTVTSKRTSPFFDVTKLVFAPTSSESATAAIDQNSPEVLGQTTQNPTISKWLLSLFMLALLSFVGAGYWLYQWYTGYRDRYLEATL